MDGYFVLVLNLVFHTFCFTSFTRKPHYLIKYHTSIKFYNNIYASEYFNRKVIFWSDSLSLSVHFLGYEIRKSRWYAASSIKISRSGGLQKKLMSRAHLLTRRECTEQENNTVAYYVESAASEMEVEKWGENDGVMSL